MQSYSPPYFNDPRRLVKLQDAFPQIDQMYKAFAKSHNFPSYAYGIILDGQLVYSGADGFIDMAQKIPATVHSMYSVASVTKSFTAMAILRLRDEHKLKLDDPVCQYIPEVEGLKITSDAPPITIRDLLIHTAGFPTDDPWADRKLGESEEKLIELLKKGIHFSNAPGCTFEYSNLGYTLLGYIIGKVSGSTYTKFIEQTVDLKGIKWESSQISDALLAHGYRWMDGNWQEEKLQSNGIFGAMGGMITSVETLSQYAAMHQYAWPPRDDPESGPLKRSSLREMHQPWQFRALSVNQCAEGEESIIVNGYGYGLNCLRDAQGRIFIGHSGGLPGFGSNWYIMPEYGIGVVLLANLTYAPAYKINLEVLDKLIKTAQLKPWQLPPSKILQERKKDLVQLLPHWKNVSQTAIFADNFFLDYPLQALQKESKNIFANIGAITEIGQLIAENQLRGHFLVSGEKKDLKVCFSLTPANPSLIQQFQIIEIEK